MKKISTFAIIFCNIFSSVYFFLMKSTSVYLLAAAMSVATFGCSKKKEDTPAPAPTKTSLLTAKNWRTTDIKIGGISVFNSPLIDACDKDDLLKFNADKSTTYDQGVLRCVQADPQTARGSWDFTTNETKLKVTDPDGDVTENTITTLNATTLVVTEPDFMGLGNSAEVTFTAQ